MTAGPMRLLALTLLVGSASMTDSRGVAAERELRREWYPDGRMRTERAYVRGVEDGVHRGWYADGAPMFERHYRRGLAQGLQREWYPDGTPYTEFTYVDGHENGRQRMWTEYGALRANYVVRAGRRFGLMGSTGCEGGRRDSSRVSP
jgi:antitoxin component YwqK of YwqJK toxin-antitoxin module